MRNVVFHELNFDASWKQSDYKKNVFKKQQKLNWKKKKNIVGFNEIKKITQKKC